MRRTAVRVHFSGAACYGQINAIGMCTVCTAFRITSLIRGFWMRMIILVTPGPVACFRESLRIRQQH